MSELHEVPAFSQVRIENTNRCAYRCLMCPREQLSRPLGTMPLADLVLTLSRLSQAPPEIHMHGFGEPLLDPELPEKIFLVRKLYPETAIIFFTTLGVTCKPDYWRRLIDSGLDGLRISCYGFSPATYAKMHGVDNFPRVVNNLRELLPLWQARGRRIGLEMITTIRGHWSGLAAAEESLRVDFFSWLRDAGMGVSESFRPHNYGGGRHYRQAATEGLCSVVWGWRRQILQVTWDLDVVPCCFDFNSTVVFGNLRNASLEEIYQGQAYRQFIAAHRRNDLSAYPVCQGCERCFLPAQ